MPSEQTIPAGYEPGDVTPQMVEAGVEAFCRWDERYGFSRDYQIFGRGHAEELVEEILVAVRRLAEDSQQP